mgnify:CR=1 FL=1
MVAERGVPITKPMSVFTFIFVLTLLASGNAKLHEKGQKTQATAPQINYPLIIGPAESGSSSGAKRIKRGVLWRHRPKRVRKDLSQEKVSEPATGQGIAEEKSAAILAEPFTDSLDESHSNLFDEPSIASFSEEGTQELTAFNEELGLTQPEGITSENLEWTQITNNEDAEILVPVTTSEGPNERVD